MNRIESSWTRYLAAVVLAAALLPLTAPPAAAQDSPEVAREKLRARLAEVEKEGDDARRVVVVQKIDDGEAEAVRRPIFLTRLMGGGYLGVELTTLTPELRSHFGAPSDRGVMIARVSEDSPAERAGLAVGDIVTDVDGEPVEDLSDLALAIRGHEAGEQADLVVWRGGSSMDVRVTVEEREREQIHLEGLLRKVAEPGDGPRVFRWSTEGDGKGIVVDTESLHALGESLGKVDWPLLEGRLVTERNRELEERLERLEKQLERLEEALRQSEERRR